MDARTTSRRGGGGDGGGRSLRCEVVLISGYGGSGKTSILRQLTSFLDVNDWFVLRCEFDRKAAPLSMLLQSVDAFLSMFVNRGGEASVSPMESRIRCAFDRISSYIIHSVDRESFVQLCDLLPNFRRLFPSTYNYYVHDRGMRNVTFDDPSLINDLSSTSHLSAGGVGSGSNRVQYLFRLIMNAVYSAGYPVSYIFEDLQWSDSISMKIIRDIIQPDGHGSTFSSEEDLSNRGLLILGSFRKNEIDEGMLINQLKTIDQNMKNNVNITTIHVDELPEEEINLLLSYKLCLPLRYTRGLAQVVHQKSRGNPLYIIEFLRFIIQNNMMSYSVKDRRWIWDETTIDLQMISDGVVELLTIKLQQLPHNVIETLKVVSCIGQIYVTTIELLEGQFVPGMLEALELAAQEGIVDRAGPIFAFTHDLLQQSTLALMPENERKLLHKQIGTRLAQVPEVADNAGLCTLAVDQINMCKSLDGMLDPMERALFARLNLAAGKHSIAAASYERARLYFEAGISLLDLNPWGEQYSLCLELYEMSAVVSFVDGKVVTVAARLDSILSNAKSFDDTLNSRALRTKFLASQGQYVEATEEVSAVLSNLGIEFSGEISSSHLMSEISATQSLLKDITKQDILNLPPMTDKKKLNTMKFLSLFLSISYFSTPLLLALYSCRMMKLSLEFGFCEETITSLVFVSFALFHYAEDTEIGIRFMRIAESLINGHPNEHFLSAKLTLFVSSVIVLVEPFQAAPDRMLKACNSALIAGEIDMAMSLSLNSSLVCIYSIPDLLSVKKDIVYFFHRSIKYRPQPIIHEYMWLCNICTAFTGCTIDTGEEIKRNEELLQFAEKTKSSFLLHHVVIGQMYIDCYFRNYSSVMNFGENYRIARRSIGERRALDFFHAFFAGISAFCLARSTNEGTYRLIGEQSVRTMTKMVQRSEWNFTNKLHLLNAQLHYLDKRNNLAENSFKAAIASAHEHGFYHEEALACELYGLFLIDTKNLVVGIEQLQSALHKYEKWGAKKKSQDVQFLIDSHVVNAFLPGSTTTK